MPLYFFHLRGDRRIADPIGTELPDESAAHAHACRVARELMRGRELSTRTRRLDVFDRDGDFCFDLIFASVDDTVAYWPPDTRNNLESFCRNRASFLDAVDQVRASMLQLKSTLGGRLLNVASNRDIAQAGR